MKRAAQKELGPDYPKLQVEDKRAPLAVWYADNQADVPEFEKQMRRKVHYVIEPQYLWGNITELARTHDDELLHTLQKGFDYIENQSFASTFKGLFSEINLASDKLGKVYAERNVRLCKIIGEIAKGLAQFSTDSDTLGDAYEYLIGQFAAGSGKKAGEFYTPQPISSILSALVTLDGHHPAARRAVPWRRRGAHSQQAAQGRPHRHSDRPAGQPVLLHRHPGLHPGAEEVQEAG
jgi:type I restriction enzyme M protein